MESKTLDLAPNGGRLPLLYPNELSSLQKELHQHFQDHLISWSKKVGFKLALSDGRLLGPLNGFLYSPVISKAYHQWVDVEHEHTSIPPKIRTMVILIIGTAWNSEFEIYAHSESARYLGWSEAAITSILNGEQPVGLTHTEMVAYRFAKCLMDKKNVDDDIYKQAIEAFTEKGVVELVQLIGIFLTVSVMLNVFKVPVQGVDCH